MLKKQTIIKIIYQKVKAFKSGQKVDKYEAQEMKLKRKKHINMKMKRRLKQIRDSEKEM